LKSDPAVCFAATALFAALAISLPLDAQSQTERHKSPIRYTVTDLGLAADQVGGINNKGWLNYTATHPDGTLHATFWKKGRKIDLGTLGGPNSSAFAGPSEKGQVVGKAETSTPDPLGEDFCLYRTNLICRGFVWQNGEMTPLTTLGGNNSWANDINNRGQVVGQTENSTRDSTCSLPQVLQTLPVIWEEGQIRELPTVGGDPDGAAFAINDNGEAVGATANCTTALHAVLWRKDGSVIDLGNLGGAMNNAAQDINSRGQVVGFSDLTGDTTIQAFLWTEDTGMQNIGTLPGGFSSFAFSINEQGQVVGGSTYANGGLRAFLRQDGIMIDLNMVIPPSFPFVLIEAFDINDRGEIVGLANDPNTDENHAFLAIPCDEGHAGTKGCEGKDTAVAEGETNVRPRVALSENARPLVGQRLGLRYHIPGPMRGTGAISGPNVTLSPTSLTFSTQAIGTTSAAKTVTLKNTGTASLTIRSIAITGTNAGDFAQTHTCGTTLAAGTSCTISVTFKPSALGTRTAALSITDNAKRSPQKVALTGTGVAPTCIPQGGVCFGPGPNRCCPAPRGHHSFCSNPTGWGTCIES
jgi:probable HAF family extracellular repeat protein